MKVSIELSQEQETFIQKALEGNNILVDACIGSGKTTSIQQLCMRLPTSKSILYLTYNRLLKVDAKTKIKGTNITVTNYHGFAYQSLKNAGITCGVTDLIQKFIEVKPLMPKYDVLIIDEYQDIDGELSRLLEIIKEANKGLQIIAVGDMMQKIYDKTELDAKAFIDRFLDNYICLTFTQCFRLSSDHAAMLGRIWKKSIVGVNDSCRIRKMPLLDAISFISSQSPKDVLCLGSRTGVMSKALNILEANYPEKYNKKTVYASISDTDGGRAVDPNADSAIFTTYDSSKGLEKKICVVFDFDESYWSIRIKQPLQSYEILRNVFCVAASRGKEEIIFVESGDQFLSERTLSTPDYCQEAIKRVGFSEMFDFKHKESVERCFSLLEIKRLPVDDNQEIQTKTHDCLIDLSPCIGIYQEASFFENYNIDKDIEMHFKLHPELSYLKSENTSQLSVAEKVLLLTSLETRQERYRTQVDLPFISEDETQKIHKRLSTVFSKADNSQVLCSKDYVYSSGQQFTAIGFADVVKYDTVYELKFVSELTHEHFLQCACYVIALGLKKGILWNTRTNEMYEISIPDEESFNQEVAKTVLKIAEQGSTSKAKGANTESGSSQSIGNASTDCGLTGCFAVIDTETNFSDRVMSIGICVFEKDSFKLLEHRYYIIFPEANEPSIYSNALRIKNTPKPMECDRKTALIDIRRVVASYSISDVFAYNASFDAGHLPELYYVSWYDIMKMAANIHFNAKLPPNTECYKTGRIKRNYGVEPMFRLLSGNKHYCETHNAARDAYDEAQIMKMLDIEYQVYLDNALIRPALVNAKRFVESKPMQNPSTDSPELTRQIGVTANNPKQDTAKPKPSFVTPHQNTDDTIFADEAAMLMGVSKSAVYNLIRRGMIAATKRGNKYHISRVSVLNYIEERRRLLRKALIATAILLGGIILFILLIVKHHLFY